MDTELGDNFGFPSILTKKKSSLKEMEYDDHDPKNEPDMRKLVAAMNRKKKKSGGFQSLGMY